VGNDAVTLAATNVTNNSIVLLVGTSGADTLRGGIGNDTLTGLAGIDTFMVDSGTDTITDLGNGGAEVLIVASGATANAKITNVWTATASTLNNGTANITTNGLAVNLSAVTTGANGFTVTNTGVASTLNLASITSPCYLYLQAPTTNGTAIWIAEGTTGVVFTQLAPGDITFMSYGQDAYPAADIQAYTPGSTATLNYFIGEKA
jgi:Ca2+-binding RTX toxin-like protein